MHGIKVLVTRCEVRGYKKKVQGRRYKAHRTRYQAQGIRMWYQVLDKIALLTFEVVARGPQKVKRSRSSTDPNLLL